MTIKYEEIFEIEHTGSDISIFFKDLPVTWIEVFANEGFNNRLGSFLLHEFLNLEVQKILKQKDYDETWGE